MNAANESAAFVRDAHGIVRDLMVPRPSWYWTDFLVTIAVAYAGLAAVVLADPAWMQLLGGGVAGLAIYRAVVFTHEITHHRGRSFMAFTFVWNVLCGIPFLMPSFMYGNHQGHHTNDTYGTWSDPEYILHSPDWRFRITVFLLLPLVYPVLMVVRFLVFTPLAMVSERINRFIWRHGSSLYVMNESYYREYDSDARSATRSAQEAACAIWVWSLAAALFWGWMDWSTVAKIYLVFLFWISLNQVRTLAAHRYRNDVNAPVTYLDQLLDTNTFSRGVLLPELWAPVGLRYHALHHLLPTMPYHSMAEAHTRLIQRLPASSPYHQTLRKGLWPVINDLLRDREYTRRPAGPIDASRAGSPDAR